MKIVDNQTVLLGPPGCGKTTSILSRIEVELQTVDPKKLALVSFTKKAVEEAVQRVQQRFKLTRDKLLYFQTVHSMCYRQLGLNRNDLMTRENFSELGEILGYAMNASISQEDGALVLPDQDKGSRLLFLDNMARIRQESVKDTWRSMNVDMSWAEVERFCTAYAEYKKMTGKLDFTDLLQRYVDSGQPLDVDVGFIDEAQDLSKLQWAVLCRCFVNAKRVVIAGDDDQSIFKWSGADLGSFLSLKGDMQVLARSYRLPKAVHKKARGIIQRVRHRFEKEFEPADKEGSVSYVSSLDAVRIDPEETTMILVRNVYLLNRVYELLKLRGLNYTGRNGVTSVNEAHVRAIICWEALRKGDALTLEDTKLVYGHLRVGAVLARGGKAALNELTESSDSFSWETLNVFYGLQDLPIWHVALEGIPAEKREYYISLLRQGKKLTAEPKIHVNTVHGVKGGEAEHVVVVTDISKKTHEEMTKDPCSEHRVFYVAVTRAKEKLTIVMPQSRFSYPC